MLIKCFFLAFFYTIVKSDVTPELETRINSPAGPLVGTLEKSKFGRTFRAFRGIPYAAPPIGERRFQRPERLEPWETERSAKQYGNICPQNDFLTGAGLVGDEDCLFLNVYTPENAHGLNVMFWIHGGGFTMGTGNQYGAEYYMDSDVVLVTMNYRLGVFGFFSTENADVPGNQAMHDMIMALQWVQDNIESFGGNPGQVTIFGESAGAVATSALRLSPLSVGLFHGVIANSGSALMAVQTSLPKKLHYTLAAVTGCPLVGIEMITCLKQLDAKELLNKTSIMNGMVPIFTFFPRIDREAGDHAIFPDHPVALLKSGAFQRVPLFTGFNAEEGIMFAVIAQSVLKGDFANTLCSYVATDRFLDCPSAARKIEKYYNYDPSKPLEAWIPVFGDSFFTFHAMEEARLSSKYSPTFVYRFDFQSRKYGSVFDLMFGQGKENYTVTYGNMGTSHGDEIRYHLPLQFDDTWSSTSLWETGSPEMKMTKSFVDIHVGFAKNGVVDIEGLNVPTFDPSKPSYVLFGGPEDRYAPETNLVRGFASSEETLDFWRKLNYDYAPRQLITWSAEFKNECHFSG